MKNQNIYLVAHYVMKPRPGVKTNVKGWMEDSSNLQYDESVEITRGLKKNSNTAKIILNFSNKTVERNGFNSDRDFKSFFKYFFEGYHQYMTAVMKNLDPAFMEEIVSELEAELKEKEAQQSQEEVAG